jgi:uncharacterized protein YuzE
MTVRMGDHEFDDVVYDAIGDVLYLHHGKPVPAAETFATPEGHAVMFDERAAIIGVTIVNAKWLMERDGRITVTTSKKTETIDSEIALALAG